MKKFYISALGMLLGLTGFAQSAVAVPQLSNRSNLQPAPAKAVAAVQANMNRKMAAAQKVQGGPVDQRISHTDVVIDQQGANLSFFIEPIFVDSTVVIDFGTPRHVTSHAIGQTFDPASEAFIVLGQDHFAQTDSYTVDSVWAAGVYDILTPGLTGATGDVLRYEIVWGFPTATGAADPFRAVQFNANTFPNQTAVFPMRPVRYAGNVANGDVGGLTWSGKITINKALAIGDSANTYHGVSVGQLIPAGAKVGVSVKYIPASAPTFGSVYFVGNGGTLTATMNSFRALLSAASSANDDYGYFLEAVEFDPASWAIPQTLFAETRYVTFSGSTAFLNELYFPAGDRGYLMDMRVSGLSTVGLNDAKAVEFVVFPNPSYGNFKVRVAEAGNYTISVLNTLGQEVLRMDASAMANETIPVNATLAKGIYLMNVTLNGVTTTEKISIR
jgi:hypothetical protein